MSQVQNYNNSEAVSSSSQPENQQEWEQQNSQNNIQQQQSQNNKQSSEERKRQNEEKYDKYDKYENENQNQVMPFVVESYNREERLRDRTNKPKLGLKRLTEDKKLVSVDIDIPIDQSTVIKDKFDWDLSKDKISPTDFAKELVNSLHLPVEYTQKIREQILSQIMEHIKANTCQKQQEQRQVFNEEQTVNKNNFNNMRFNYNEYPEDDLMEKQENQKKKMSRMRRIQMKKVTQYLPTQPNRYFKEKKTCRNCKNENNAPGYQCKNCKLPFQLMESLNFDDKRVKISAKYYQKIANKIPLLIYEAKKKNFEKEDFDSFYRMYIKIKNIFEQSDELSKQSLNQVKYIMEKYHEQFLTGNLDFNDDDIIYDKDMKKGDKKEEQNRPRRARGRPRKLKIINDDLVPNSNQNSEQEPSESSSSDGEESLS